MQTGGQEGRQVSGQEAGRRPLPLLSPLVQSARLCTYLTGSHTGFLFYYRQSQGQPLLSNKRNALNSLSLMSNPEPGAGAGRPVLGPHRR